MTSSHHGVIAQLVRVSHWHRKVVGSNPLEVLNFSGFATHFLTHSYNMTVRIITLLGYSIVFTIKRQNFETYHIGKSSFSANRYKHVIITMVLKFVDTHCYSKYKAFI